MFNFTIHLVFVKNRLSCNFQDVIITEEMDPTTIFQKAGNAHADVE